MKAWNSTLSAGKGFKRRSKPLKRSPITRKPSKKPKVTKADLWRSYGLERPAKPRYVGLKGIYWYVLSRVVRQRDFKKWGKCINCGGTVTSWQELQGGHYISAERCGWLLLFDQRNVNGECPACNKYDKQKLGYERNLLKRYGRDVAYELKKEYWESKQGTPAKEWSQREYHHKILELQKQLV